MVTWIRALTREPNKQGLDPSHVGLTGFVIWGKCVNLFVLWFPICRMWLMIVGVV